MKSRPDTIPLPDDDGSESRAIGLGPESAGQSGDNQGLDSTEISNSESVNELLEEGQYYEASVVDGIENAASADEKEVWTQQVDQNDVPEEYEDEVEFRK